MLVLSIKKRQSVVVECSEGFHQQLRVKPLEIRNGKVVLGFVVEDVVPGPALKLWKGTGGKDGSNGASTRRGTTKSEINRWNDDGGNSLPRIHTHVAVKDRVVGNGTGG